ncbi:hypothetical protein PR202_ga19331 [Eleusine coracana subsp. coracana]|uniref:Uncharacterized protein n=1 Tax=Eleusine coracana subsp. coracana TaxID=191504 RepID=A0AAV5CW57_ELECO|nr:hypothetical protein PR202_ga19331 [Eleusine coracana subsp. coracana]
MTVERVQCRHHSPCGGSRARARGRGSPAAAGRGTRGASPRPRGAVALAVVVHLAAEAGAAARVLAGEEVDLRGGAWRHPGADADGGGAGDGEGVPAARGEDEREEDDHGDDEDRPDDVEERPLVAAGEGAAAVRRQRAEEPHGEWSGWRRREACELDRIRPSEVWFP